MFKQVEHWCKSNVAFSMRKSPRNSKKSNLAPNERVAVDVLGPFPSPNKGSRHIVVFSNWPNSSD